MVSDYRNEKFSVAWLSVGSNLVLVLMKLGVGIAMGSVAVLSEAIHSGLDLAASAIACYAVVKAEKPADERHQYGHGKWENVSGVIEALLITVAAVYIIYEGIQRLMHGSVVEHLGLGTAVMCFSATVNWVVSARILKAARRSGSIALHADALHLRADVYTSIGVLTGLVLVALTGVTVFDSIAAIVVALMILKSSIDLARDALGDIFDVSLPPEEEERIRTVLSGYKDGCIDFHRLRGRKSGADRFIDVHLVVPTGWTIDQAHELADAIEKEIGETVPNAHAVIHIDPCTKSIEPCNACSSEEAEGERRGKSPE